MIGRNIEQLPALHAPTPAVRLEHGLSAGQRRLVGADRAGETDFQRVGGQFMADRGFRQVRQRRDEVRQVLQIEVVAGIDDQPGAAAREAVSAQARSSAAPSPARNAAA